MNTIVKKYISIILVTVLVIMGTSLRLYRLSNDSLWFDEIATNLTSSHDIQLEKNKTDSYSFTIEKIFNPPTSLSGKTGQVIKNTTTDNIHLPLYYILIFFVKQLFGDSEFWLRFPSVFFGSACIIIMYPLSRLFCNKKGALLSTALMALMWYPIHFSREARMYTLLLLTTMISTYYIIVFYKRLKKSELSYKDLILYTIFAILTINVHFYGFYFISIQVFFTIIVFIIINKEININKSKLYILLILSLGTISVFSFPIILKMITVLQNANNITNIMFFTRPDLSQYHGFLSAYLSYPITSIISINMAPSTVKSSIIRNIVIVLSIIIILKQLKIKKTEKGSALTFFHTNNMIITNSTNYILLIWLFVPTTIAFLLSQVIQPIFLDRGLIYCLPALYILVAKMITDLSRNKLVFSILSGCFLLLILFDLIYIKNIYSGANNMQFKETVLQIKSFENKYPDYFIGSNVGRFGLDYYAERFNLKNRSIYFVKDYSITDFNGFDTETLVKEQHQDLYDFVIDGGYTHMWYVDILLGNSKKNIPDDFNEISIEHNMGIDVVLYELSNVIQEVKIK